MSVWIIFLPLNTTPFYKLVDKSVNETQKKYLYRFLQEPVTLIDEGMESLENLKKIQLKYNFYYTTQTLKKNWIKNTGQMWESYLYKKRRNLNVKRRITRWMKIANIFFLN